MRSGAILLVTVFLSVASSSGATDMQCHVRVLHVVSDDFGNVRQVGAVLPADIQRDDAKSRFYCAHGGACLPQMAEGVEATRLVDCRPGATIAGGDRRLEPDPDQTPAPALRRWRSRDAVEQRLSALGFSNAAAAGLADVYSQAPRSRVGSLVARALAGSSAALSTLKRTHP